MREIFNKLKEGNTEPSRGKIKFEQPISKFNTLHLMSKQCHILSSCSPLKLSPEIRLIKKQLGSYSSQANICV